MNNELNTEFRDAHEALSACGIPDICEEVDNEHFFLLSERIKMLAEERDHFKAQSETAANRWIPVTERLPEPETKVLALCGGYPFVIAGRYPGRYDGDGWNYKYITHWMPIHTPAKQITMEML